MTPAYLKDRADSVLDEADSPSEDEGAPLQRPSMFNLNPNIGTREMSEVNVQKSIFDNLDALRLSSSEAGVGAGVDREVESTIAVRRPRPREYFMVHPDPAMSLTTAVVFDREEMRNDVFFVAPNMRDMLVGETRPVLLVPAITRQDVMFIWPLPLPVDGRQNYWHERARLALERGKARWTRMAADMTLGTYRLYEPVEGQPDPVWPNRPLEEILKVAFAGKVIDSVDHPFVRRIQGRA